MPVSERQREGERQDPKIRSRLNQQRLLLRDEGDQTARQRHRQRDADRAADERQQHAFRQQLSHQLTACRAERQAHRDLALPHEAARDQQVRDVRARDQQHEPDHRHQHDERGREVVAQRRIADVRLVELQLSRHEALADEGRPVLRARQRHLVLADLREQPLQRSLRGLDRVAGLEPREHLHPARALIVHVHPSPLGHDHRLHQDRHAHLRRARRIDAGKTLRGHADDRHGVVVDEDLLADRLRVAIESPRPVVVADHDRWVTLVDLIVFLRIEDASRRRSHAEHREVVARHHLDVDALGLVVDRDRGVGQPARQHFAERLGALLVLLVDRIGVHARAHVAAAVRARLIQHHQLVRVLHRQLAQQDLVDQREDRGVRADAERERQDRDDRKQRAAKEAADGQLEVVGWQRHSGG